MNISFLKFKQEVEAFWFWVSDRTRRRSSFYLSLKEWADQQFNLAYEAEQVVEKAQRLKEQQNAD